jgi:ubiquinone/menaquinone biosynthesis C-methylase UbiE
MTDTIHRFSNRVENYVKYRPHYPAAAVDYLNDTIGLNTEKIIADIGCGTGISSELFLKNGNTVLGVEPNELMRNAAIEYLRDLPNFKPLAATAEETTLDDDSVDVVLAGQAFHWFDLDKTKKEFKRILKPNGHVVLMWNERQLDTTPFLVEYEKILLKYATDYAVVRHDKFDEQVLDRYFDNGVKKVVFENVQTLDFEGLKGRMLSASYMPTEQNAIFPAMIDELSRLFAEHSENGRIDIIYDTNVYVSQV